MSDVDVLLKAIADDEALFEQLAQTETVGDFQAIMLRHGFDVTVEQIEQMLAMLEDEETSDGEGELTEEHLNDVSGGALVYVFKRVGKKLLKRLVWRSSKGSSGGGHSFGGGGVGSR